jgi:prefoldin subunit 4
VPSIVRSPLELTINCKLTKEDEATTNGEEVEVRKEDQEKINKFSRLHQQELKVEEELKAKQVRGYVGTCTGADLSQKDREDLEEVLNELELADEDDKIP